MFKIVGDANIFPDWEGFQERVLTAWARGYVIRKAQKEWNQLPPVKISVPLDIGQKIDKKRPNPPDRKRGRPLFDTGRLFRSLTFKPDRPLFSNMEIGTNVEYAEQHFYGLTSPITDTMRKLWIKKYGYLVKAKQITPVKREFLKVDDEAALKRLEEIIAMDINGGGN